MSDPSLELQAALVVRLKNNCGAAADRVFDRPAANATFPYLTLGEGQVLPDKADCIDGVVCYPVINVWSRAVGYLEAKAVAKAVLDALDDRPLAVEGFAVVVFELHELRYLRDPDGITSRAVITFHALIQPS